jgi:5'-nucleotidase
MARHHNRLQGVAMKYTLPILAIVLLAAGCQSNGSSSAMSPSSTPVTDVSMTPAPITTATPAAYTPAPVQTPATVTPAMDTAPVLASGASSTGTTYKVKAGDTLWKLAATHYGNGNQWKKIADANPGLTPSTLKVGQTITIP